MRFILVFGSMFGSSFAIFRIFGLWLLGLYCRGLPIWDLFVWICLRLVVLVCPFFICGCVIIIDFLDLKMIPISNISCMLKPMS